MHRVCEPKEAGNERASNDDVEVVLNQQQIVAKDARGPVAGWQDLHVIDVWRGNLNRDVRLVGRRRSCQAHQLAKQRCRDDEGDHEPSSRQ